jgi:hypothetical protein
MRMSSSGEGMRDLLHAVAGWFAILGMVSANAISANAAGALAVGACAAYGYAYDYPSPQTAQAAAIEKCGGSCKKAVTTQKGCVALAIDGQKPCGPNGFADAPPLGAAQNSALKYCYQHGGKNCMIRAWICDGKKG